MDAKSNSSMSPPTSRDVDVNDRDSGGNTPLMAAVVAGQLGCVDSFCQEAINTSVCPLEEKFHLCFTGSEKYF